MEEEKELEIEKLNKKLEDAKSSSDKEGIFESLFGLLKIFENDSDFNMVLDLIDENYPLLEDDQERNQILNKKSTALLKLEEYNDLLKTLEEKKKLKGLSLTEKANIFFYESICFESLDEIDLSIKSLESIDDNISKYSLINKYIKLSILYSSLGDIKKAKESYDYAGRLDTYHTNEMFLLAESDLFFLNKEYLEAMSSFESFFLKSKNKFKYLDRYIRISIQLNRLDDAYNFYKKYINYPSIRLSKTCRYAFLKASKELLLKMNKKEEIESIDSEMEKVKPLYFNKLEKTRERLSFEIIKSSTLPLTRFDRRKNIANKFFKMLDQDTYHIIAYIEEMEDGILYYKFTGKEMKERPIDKTSLSPDSLAFFDSNNKVTDFYLTDKLERVDEKVSKYVIENEYRRFGYFISSFSPENDYIFEMLQNSLLNAFLRLESITNLEKDKNALVSLNSTSGYAFFKVSNDYIEAIGDFSRKLLGFKNSIMKYNDFLSLFTESFYFDSFKDRDEKIEREMIEEDGSIRKMEIVHLLFENENYLRMKDITLESSKKEKDDNYLFKSDLNIRNVNSFKERVEKEEDSYAIIGFTIPIVEEMDVLDIRDSKINVLYESLLKACPNEDCFYIGENHFLIVSKSIDKRNLVSLYERVDDQIKRLYKYSYSLRMKKTPCFITKAVKGKTYSEIKDIMNYGFYVSTDKCDLVILDNEEKKEYALYKVYESEVIRALKDKTMPLDYYPILDEKTNTIHYFLPRFSLPYSLDYKTYVKILRKNFLESRSDMVLLEKLVEDAKDFDRNTRFILQFNKESIIDSNFIKRFSTLYKQSNLKGRLIILTDTVSFKDFEKGLESLHNMGLHLAALYSFESPDSKDFMNYSMVFINTEEKEYRRKIAELLRDVLKKRVVLVDSSPLDDTLSFRSSYKVYTKEKIMSFTKKE